MRSDARFIAGALALGLVSFAAAGTARAQAQIVVVNKDDPGAGFNDPTPVTPVGGNTETTLGAQRMKVFQAAADLWGQRVKSSVVIRVAATFAALDCSSTSAVLGRAGPQQVFRDGGLPITGTWYYGALANAITNDVNTDREEITAQFNGALGTTCSFPRTWYYGLDGNAPSTQIDLFTVVYHELTHGLGFLSLVDSKGKKFNGFDDVFSRNLLDLVTNQGWSTLTDAQRVASEVSLNKLVWAGPTVVAASGSFTLGVNAGRPLMYAPLTYSSGSSVSHWDTTLTPDETMEPFYTTPTHEAPLAIKALADEGWQIAAGGPTGGGSVNYFLASSAHAPGAGGVFYTTDLTIGNRGSTSASFTIKFLGNNKDGRAGSEQSFNLGAGQSVTYTDVLGSLFGASNDYGALRISSSSSNLNIAGQTATPNGTGAGTFGQSVPAFSGPDLVTSSSPKSIVAIREDSKARTNLIVVNAGESAVDVDLVLMAADGSVLGQQRLSPRLQPLEMRQISKVAQQLSGGTVVNGTLVISTPTQGGSVAAYASAIDNGTGDPRTLLAK